MQCFLEGHDILLAGHVDVVDPDAIVLLEMVARLMRQQSRKHNVSLQNEVVRESMTDASTTAASNDGRSFSRNFFIALSRCPEFREGSWTGISGVLGKGLQDLTR